MTRKEFKSSVWQATLSIMKRKGLNLNSVVVNRVFSTISIGNSFFAQGEDADELIAGIPEDINERVWMVYYLDSAGIQF